VSPKKKSLAATIIDRLAEWDARVQVVVEELPRQWYHFITTTCAIVGGVFTVCGILDGISFSAQRILKKVELGKQG
jgi:hypothetical protein